MLMQGACQNMGWKIQGQWSVTPPESFRTGRKEISWYLQLLLDSNSLPSCYFGEKRQGYLSGFFCTNIFPWGNVILLRGWDVSVENFTPCKGFNKQFDVWRPLPFSIFIPLLLTTFLPLLFLLWKQKVLAAPHTNCFSLSQEWLWACVQSWALPDAQTYGRGAELQSQMSG